MTKDDITKLALEAGFSKYESWCLSGNSEDDRLVAVEEYPVGEAMLKFAAAIAAAEREECATWYAEKGWLLDEDDVVDAMRKRDAL